MSTAGLTYIPSEKTLYNEGTKTNRTMTNNFFVEYNNEIYDYRCGKETRDVVKARSCNCEGNNRNSIPCLIRKEMQAARAERRFVEDAVTNNYTGSTIKENPLKVTDKNIQNIVSGDYISASIMSGRENPYASLVTNEFTDLERTEGLQQITGAKVTDGTSSVLGSSGSSLTYSAA